MHVNQVQVNQMYVNLECVQPIVEVPEKALQTNITEFIKTNTIEIHIRTTVWHKDLFI